MTFTVSRRIELDAGHRIATHGSKCRHLHGHRYAVEAVVRAAALHESGEQSGMAIDFGFLKAEMMAVIDRPCDHGLILCVDDRAALEMLVPEGREFAAWHAGLVREVAEQGFCSTQDARMEQKLYVIPGQPTAETLARHWHGRLAQRVRDASGGYAELAVIRVWETPNCWAEFGLG
jgi:6-pyruvoyltetrahydropterin/6-carboxytetrahydropterin synthase